MPTIRSAVSLSAAATVLVVALAACSPSATPPPSSGPGALASSAPAVPTPQTSASASDDGTALGEYAVAAAHPAAVAAGMEILEAGGNAADAAVASAFAVAVVEPFASGIGGGGSTVLAEPGQSPVAYDYREVVGRNGVIPASGTGIPGFVAGMAEIHGQHGRLEWSQLLVPAIELAEEGFEISPFLAQRMRSDAGPAALDDLPHFKGLGGVALLGEGDQLVQQDLAGTMKVLSKEGPDAFYTGSLVDELTAVEGIDAASLAAYETETLEPASGRFGQYEVVSAAPALPGAALIQMLQVAESLGIAEDEPGSGPYVDKLARAWSVADESVERHFGDQRYVDVPVDRLTNAKANAALAKQATAAEREDVAARAPEPIVAGNTTHLTVVDAHGFTVSMTNTITNFWGGGKTENVGGFFLNNQLSRFASLDTPNNQPEPGRKSVSWAAPSLVLDAEGRVVLGLGSPGGHQIPNILSGVLVPWALQDAELQEAVDAPRSHFQDGVLALESEPGRDVSALAARKGWKTDATTREEAVFGSVQALEIDHESGSIVGATDSRREAAFDSAAP